MDNNQATQLVMAYGNRFPDYALPSLHDRLVQMDYATAGTLLARTKDPIISLVISLVAGHFGIDRFYLGDTLYGVFKLLTCGGLGIWTLVDFFLIIGATKEKNYALLNGRADY